MLEDPADGLGCWSLAGATLAAIPCNATYSSFAKLAAGGYGEAPLQPGHVLLAVNAEWTGPGDIGQPWQRWVPAVCWEGGGCYGCVGGVCYGCFSRGGVLCRENAGRVCRKAREMGLALEAGGVQKWVGKQLPWGKGVRVIHCCQ